MKVEIWSDVVCPWCYLGKRRFEHALARSPHAATVELIWRSFELDPSAPPVHGVSLTTLLAKKYGMPEAEAAARQAELTALGAEDGIAYRFDLAKSGNTFDAHRLIHYAGKAGKSDAMQERLMRGYFTEGLAIGDRDALVTVASELGFEAEAARAVLSTDAHATDVRADERRSSALGFRGVPAFLFDGKLAVSGAQSVEVFTTAIERAAALTS